MKYRHFPAAVLAAGLLFCTLFSGFAAYADDKKGELTQNQTEARQEYEAEQAALNELKSAQAQTENEVAALTGQAAELAGQITDVTAAVQAAQTELDVRRAAAEAAGTALTAKQAEYDARLATVYKGNIIKNLIMDCQSYTKYRPNETTGGIFVSWRRKEELPTGA